MLSRAVECVPHSVGDLRMAFGHFSGLKTILFQARSHTTSSKWVLIDKKAELRGGNVAGFGQVVSLQGRPSCHWSASTRLQDAQKVLNEARKHIPHLGRLELSPESRECSFKD